MTTQQSTAELDSARPLVVLVPGKQEEDLETATQAHRLEGVREAGWGEGGRVVQGCVWSKQEALESPSLSFASQPNGLKGNEMEQMAIRRQVWSSLRKGPWVLLVCVVILVSSGVLI